MNWGAVLQWAGTGGLAAIIALAVSWPKNKGEGKQAASAGEKSLSDARAQEQLLTLQQTREAADRAEKSRLRAEDAERICLGEKRSVVLAFDRFINRMERLVDRMPESLRDEARDAISLAREAI